MEFQKEKQVIRTFHNRLEAAGADQIADVMAHFGASDMTWRGFHPFGVLTAPEAVGATFWAPLKSAMTRLQFREDVFFAGTNQAPGQTGTWVVSMGHLMGLFDKPWLGIRPTGKLVMLRYSAFYRVDGDKITETAMYFDIPHLMAQAGQNPFPNSTGQHLVQPGPATHSGLLYDPQPEAEGVATMAAHRRKVTGAGVGCKR